MNPGTPMALQRRQAIAAQEGRSITANVQKLGTQSYSMVVAVLVVGVGVLSKAKVFFFVFAF